VREKTWEGRALTAVTAYSGESGHPRRLGAIRYVVAVISVVEYRNHYPQENERVYQLRMRECVNCISTVFGRSTTKWNVGTFIYRRIRGW
jgi:hypothetical protein